MTTKTETAAAPAGAAAVADSIQLALADAFRAASAENPHDPSVLTMSGLGGCTRKAAYQLAGAEASDDPGEQESRAAHMGTAIHEWLLPRLAERLGGADFSWVEKPVTLAAGERTIHGSADLHTLAIGDGVLLDLKTVGRTVYDHLGSAEISRSHWMQTVGYAAALVQAGEDVQWIAVVYLDRDTGRTMTVVRPMDDEAVRALYTRIAELEAWAATPDTAPREAGEGPPRTYVCESCPFRTACAPPALMDIAPGSELAPVEEEQLSPGVTEAATALAEARAHRRRWEGWVDYWEAELAMTGAGVYTDGHGARVRVAWRSTGERDDQTAMRARLLELGQEIPKRAASRWVHTEVNPKQAAPRAARVPRARAPKTPSTAGRDGDGSADGGAAICPTPGNPQRFEVQGRPYEIAARGGDLSVRQVPHYGPDTLYWGASMDGAVEAAREHAAACRVTVEADPDPLAPGETVVIVAGCPVSAHVIRPEPDGEWLVHQIGSIPWTYDRSRLVREGAEFERYLETYYARLREEQAAAALLGQGALFD